MLHRIPITTTYMVSSLSLFRFSIIYFHCLTQHWHFIVLRMKMSQIHNYKYSYEKSFKDLQILTNDEKFHLENYYMIEIDTCQWIRNQVFLESTWQNVKQKKYFNHFWNVVKRIWIGCKYNLRKCLLYDHKNFYCEEVHKITFFFVGCTRFECSQMGFKHIN